MSDCIVCLCVIKPGRELLALRAMVGFVTQTHKNRVLLLAGSPQSLSLIRDKMTRWNDEQVLVREELQPNVPLLETYRRLLDKARTLGDYLCFMDDDDVSHPDRLMRQYQSLYDGKAVFLSGGLLHFLTTGEVYVIEYEKRFDPLVNRVLLGSFLVPFEGLPELAALTHRNVSWSLGQQLVKASGKNGPVRICYEPWWIKSGVHADNRQTYEHFRELAAHSERSASAAELFGKQCFLTRMLHDYEWDEAIVLVQGRDGKAYTFVPSVRVNPYLPELKFPEIQTVNEDV